jgi:hypothetical protein
MISYKIVSNTDCVATKESDSPALAVLESPIYPAAFVLTSKLAVSYLSK